MRIVTEELADWIECGVMRQAQVTEAELSGVDRGAYELFKANLLGIALIGKVGDAVQAYKYLDLEFEWKQVTKIRSLTTTDLARALGLSFEVAEAIEELHRLYRVPPSHITKLLRNLQR